MQDIAHLASVRVEAPSDFTFGHLADGRKLGRWALGSMDLQPEAEPGLWRGVSLFDGSEAAVEIRPHPDLGLIDFHLGAAGARAPRVSIRVTPGPDWGLPAGACLVAMTTWRAGWMDDDRWMRTRKTHELEVLLFKAQIETDWHAA
ncbi:hypothetical protein GCM10007291_19120 [Gemmobacter nanjingensis]|uniref:Activator of Hsp90 ATPase homolog 1-like protein n=1 Tax=Gemmobacter nanjingensis TaxID=488454 RepID=A0ABQ3FEH0_9RHOB|nr:hypothetical protein [Gemmobacter nanjingensis]GHC20339.1 hypothetical protein GCM10007291_19120 [Gemmobacter nanjingensis]